MSNLTLFSTVWKQPLSGIKGELKLLDNLLVTSSKTWLWVEVCCLFLNSLKQYVGTCQGECKPKQDWLGPIPSHDSRDSVVFLDSQATSSLPLLEVPVRLPDPWPPIAQFLSWVLVTGQSVCFGLRWLPLWVRGNKGGKKLPSRK